MRGTSRFAAAFMGFALLPSAASAQGIDTGRSGPRTVLDVDREVALALSAAPPAISSEATVFVWTADGFETAVEGSSDTTCYVARSWPDSLEPHCFDGEGSRTILPIHMRQMELWHEGRPKDEIDAEIAEGLRSGLFRLPSRPAMSYMMSEGQELISDEGDPAGNWEPHLMIYFPWLTSTDLGLGDVPSTDAAMVVDPGSPFSNIMIVVEEHVPVGPPPTP